MWFFFFKQKPAYEMRISDWSSDVCSSDLHAALSEVHKRVKEGVPLSRAMAVAPKLFPPMTAAMAEAGEANGKLAPALAKLAETLERSESLRQTIVSALIYPAMLFAIAGGVILMRSEEHTSELQSLMRISYAVFCLKTKKNYKI